MAVKQINPRRVREIAWDNAKSSLKKALGMGLPAGFLFLVICLVRGDKSVTGPFGRIVGFLSDYGDILMITGLLVIALGYGALIRLHNKDKNSHYQA